MSVLLPHLYTECDRLAALGGSGEGHLCAGGRRVLRDRDEPLLPARPPRQRTLLVIVNFLVHFLQVLLLVVIYLLLLPTVLPAVDEVCGGGEGGLWGSMGERAGD